MLNIDGLDCQPCYIIELKERKQGDESHHGLAIYIKKYLKAKEELWKLKYFTMQKNIPIFKKKILQKKPESLKLL